MKASLTCVAVLLVLAQAADTARAQPLTASTYEDMIRVAEEQVEMDRPYNALEWFEKAYAEEPTPGVAYRMGELNFELRDYRRAASNFRRAMRKAADGELVEGLYYMGVAEKMQGNYPEALEHLREFQRMAPGHELQERADLEIAGAQMAMELTDPPRIRVENAGRGVNTSNQEYSPVLAGDGNLYYAGFGKNGYVKEEGEDAASIRLYVARAPEDGGEFGKGSPLPKALNRGGYQTANVAVSADGNTMLFVRTELEGVDVVSARLYYAVKGGNDRWGEVRPVEGFRESVKVLHPAYGELFGREVVLFASDMPGGQGGLDLYYATKRGEGQYDSPVNLGPAINTPYDEVTPFYNDGTLYFSTDGRPTLGGFDVFRSDWSGDAWSAPENMGKGFNSSLDDRYFGLDASGKRGVLASNRPPTRSVKSKTCCDDVFLLEVEPILIDLLALTIDEDGQLLPGVTVDLLELEGGDTTILARKLNPKGNRFDFQLFDDKAYAIVGRRDGYEEASLEFNTAGITETASLERTLVLLREKLEQEITPGGGEETIEITLNQPIRLANIYYDFDDDKILPDAEPDLQYILDLMEDYPEMVVELGSHTDARGNDAYNQALSQRRAESAVAWIAERGVDRARLRARGYGEEVILNRCANGVRCDDDEHRFNRRTEFKIIEGPTTIEVKKLTKTVRTPDRGALPKLSIAQDTLPDGAELLPGGGFELRRDRQRIRVAPGPTDGASRQPVRPPSDELILLDDRERGGNAAEPAGEVLNSEVAFERVDAETVAKSRNGRVVDDLSALYYESDLTGLPVLEFDARRIDFGTVARGDKRRYRYTFRNVGDAPASIGIASACTCTTLDWTRGEIAPGGTGFVDAIFDSTEKEAGELIVIDVILDQETASGAPIIEQVQYRFALEGEE